MTIKIRPRILLEATIWQGEPFEGLDRVPGDGGVGHELVLQSIDGQPTIVPGDWIITRSPGQFFGCPAAMFEESYEVVG